MPCQLVVTDPNLKRVLGRSENETVAFDSFNEYLTAVPVGTEILIAESDGHFIGTFRQLAYDSGNIRLLYTSEYGRGSVPIAEVLGWATKELLQSNQEALNPLAKARLIEPVPTEFDPETQEESADNAGGSVTSETADYDEENSSIKIEQFESTTGQDVESDFTASLNSKPSTLSRMALKSMVAENPGKFRYFIVKDSPAYFNESGIEPEGEVLLVVHRAAHDRQMSELGRELTQDELLESAVRLNGTAAVAEGQIYTLPLEGTSPSRAVPGEEDQFFQRKHEERIQIYAEKNGVTEDEAEYHFRQGQENMRNMREQAAFNPVEVSVRPSLGFFPNNPMPIAQFEKKYGVEDASFDVNLNKSKVVGRVYLKGTIDGVPVEMLTVPVNLLDKYGLETLSGIAGKFLTGSASQEEINFFASIFGVSRRKAGPYMRIEGEVSVIMNQGRQVTSVDQFNEAMGDNSWPTITNKVRGKESLNQHTVLAGGSYRILTADEFVKEHVTTDGGLWTHRGKPVPFAANRYFYIDPVQEASTAISLPESNQAGTARVVNGLFSNLEEFDRLVGSSDPADVEVKLTAPQVFSPAFPLSISYKRLRAGIKAVPKTLAGAFSLDIPVGDEYFSNRRDVVDRLPGLPWPDAMVTVTQRAASRLSELNKEGVFDVEALGLDTDMSLEDFIFTFEANNLIAEIERSLLYGAPLVAGTVPDVTRILAMPAEMTFAAQFANEELVPTQIIRSVQMEDKVMTLDTYRLYKQLNGTWGSEEESAYQAQLKDPGSVQFKETQVELAYSGPVNVKISGGVITDASESLTTGPIRYRVLLPSNPADAELHRQLLLAGAGLTTDSGETRYIGNFIVPGQAQMNSLETVLRNLPVQPSTKKPAKTDLFEYAEAVLGKNLAEKILVSNKNLTFDDINAFAKYLGDDQFPNTQFKTQKDFAISPNTAQAIAEGQKKITLRKRADETVGVVNTGGLVQIDGKVFDMVDMGEMGLKRALEVTGLTQNEFAQQFLGDDTKTIDSIFDPGVKAFFDGSGARRVFMIKPVVKPFKTNSNKKGSTPKKRTTGKTKTLGCKSLR